MLAGLTRGAPQRLSRCHWRPGNPAVIMRTNYNNLSCTLSAEPLRNDVVEAVLASLIALPNRRVSYFREPPFNVVRRHG